MKLTFPHLTFHGHHERDEHYSETILRRHGLTILFVVAAVLLVFTVGGLVERYGTQDRMQQPATVVQQNEGLLGSYISLANPEIAWINKELPLLGTVVGIEYATNPSLIQGEAVLNPPIALRPVMTIDAQGTTGGTTRVTIENGEMRLLE